MLCWQTDFLAAAVPDYEYFRSIDAREIILENPATAELALIGFVTFAVFWAFQRPRSRRELIPAESTGIAATYAGQREAAGDPLTAAEERAA